MSTTGMNAAQVRWIVFTNADLVALRTAILAIRTRNVTALETGVAAENTIKDLSYIEFLPLFFDGFKYVQVLLTTTG